MSIKIFKTNKIGFVGIVIIMVVTLVPSGLVVRFIHWTPKGNVKVTDSIY